jgi:hypothetical protein
MKRSLLFAGFAFVFLGCQLPPERLPRQLPDDNPSLPYAELLTRARAQARVATESLFVDRWADLEDAARGLEQTAKFMLKADDVPISHKVALPKVCAALTADAVKLHEAAVAKNAKESTDILRRVNLAVRELRLDPGK